MQSGHFTLTCYVQSKRVKVDCVFNKKLTSVCIKIGSYFILLFNKKKQIPVVYNQSYKNYMI